MHPRLCFGLGVCRGLATAEGDNGPPDRERAGTSDGGGLSSLSRPSIAARVRFQNRGPALVGPRRGRASSAVRSVRWAGALMPDTAY